MPAQKHSEHDFLLADHVHAIRHRISFLPRAPGLSLRQQALAEQSLSRFKLPVAPTPGTSLHGHFDDTSCSLWDCDQTGSLLDSELQESQVFG
jgi:hypothetical protein